AGGGEPVCDLEGQALRKVAIDRDDHLVALVFDERLAAGRDPVLAGDYQHRERRSAGSHAVVQLAPGVVLRELLVLGLEQNAAARRARGRPELDEGVALLAPALGGLGARMRRDVAAHARD